MLNSHPTVVLTDRKSLRSRRSCKHFTSTHLTFTLHFLYKLITRFSHLKWLPWPSPWLHLMVYNIFHISHDNHFIQRHIIVCYKKYKYTCFANEYKTHVAYVICTLLTFVMFLLWFSHIYIGVDCSSKINFKLPNQKSSCRNQDIRQ